GPASTSGVGRKNGTPLRAASTHESNSASRKSIQVCRLVFARSLHSVPQKAGGLSSTFKTACSRAANASLHAARAQSSSQPTIVSSGVASDSQHACAFGAVSGGSGGNGNGPAGSEPTPHSPGFPKSQAAASSGSQLKLSHWKNSSSPAPTPTH